MRMFGVVLVTVGGGGERFMPSPFMPWMMIQPIKRKKKMRAVSDNSDEIPRRIVE